MINKLTDEQVKFLQAEGKVVVKACPGSGKTFSVANKLLSYLQDWHSPHQGIAVLSFTNVASDEIFRKANSINGSIAGVVYPHFVGTVDSFINEYIVLRYGHLYTANKNRPQIALKDIWKFPYKYWRTECHRNGCVENIEKFHYSIDGKLYKEKNTVDCELGRATALPCAQYKRILAKKDIVFQNETATFAYKLMKKFPIIVNAITERFPIIIIDEVQDTSVEQMAVFDLLSANGIKSIFLVGDPDQAIYEWRNANPQCFIDKLNNDKWDHIELTGNFRSSQNICNATSLFSESLSGHKSNTAIGNFKDEPEKPILLLYNNKCTEEQVISYFLEKCKAMKIEICPENVAVLTRGRIHGETDISNLWKSNELESYALSAYEWKKGSRKEAYKEAYHASYSMIYNEQAEPIDMENKIQRDIGKEVWENFIIDILSEFPDVELGIAEWVTQFTIKYKEILKVFGLEISKQKNIENCFKIKTRDTKNPTFREIPLRKFFEKRVESCYTRSSIHGIKGETYDATLLYIKSRTGNTITPKFLTEGALSDEQMRIAYVAMTRPRRLLMVAMPEIKGIDEYPRFPTSYWNYIRL